MKDLVTVRRALKEKYRLQEQTRREIQSLTEAYEVELHGSRGIFVSDHAIVRYLERVKGWTFKSDTDAERLGVRGAATPRQADVLLITGYLTTKTLKRVLRVYEQMQDPKYVIGFGSCTINGGMYYDSYNTIKVLDKYLPVDVYINGCMPRPEAVLAGFGKLQELIGEGKANGATKYKENLEWYRANQKKVIPTWKRPEYNW